MDNNQIEKFHEDYWHKLHVQNGQFFDWLTKTFWFSNELQKSYNRFYQELFIIHIYQLLTEGKVYIEKNLSIKTESSNDFGKFKELERSILKIESTLTEYEMEYIEHARHCSCHIFQNKYEKELKKDGTIKTKRKGKEIDELRCNISKVHRRQYDDSNFNKYFNDKMYPILTELYNKLIS